MRTEATAVLLTLDYVSPAVSPSFVSVISLLKQQPLIVWTGDSQQTPGGIARAAPNAKRSRQLLLAKKHGLRSDKNYYMPSTLADAMTRLLASSSNDSLTALAEILHAGENTLGNLWTDQLHPRTLNDLQRANAILPGITNQFQPAKSRRESSVPDHSGPNSTRRFGSQFPKVFGTSCLDTPACHHAPSDG